jgi:hypothetical protein
LLTEKGDNSLEFPNLDFCKMTPVSPFGTKKKAGLYITVDYIVNSGIQSPLEDNALLW